MAIRVEHSVVIERPIEEVFAFAADPNNNPLWQSITLETQTVSGVEVDVETTFNNVIKFLGRRIETTLEVVESEPPRRQCVRVYLRANTGLGMLRFRARRRREYTLYVYP